MTDDHRSKVTDPILDYPEFAATLGMLVSQATYLEAQLAELFGSIVGCNSSRGNIIYWSFPTFNQRQRVMHALLDDGCQPHKRKITAILKRAKKFLKFRNGAVHDLWSHRDIGGSPVYRITVNTIRNSKPETVRIMLRDMKRAVETAVRINADLMDLINEI
jgi:hypothetical protein